MRVSFLNSWEIVQSGLMYGQYRKSNTIEDRVESLEAQVRAKQDTLRSLVKKLEELGIGRPSTYAATISTILDRGYVRVEERRLRPELIGEIVDEYDQEEAQIERLPNGDVRVAASMLMRLSFREWTTSVGAVKTPVRSRPFL